jgi:hypothetical protein
MSDLLGPASHLISWMPDWIEYPLVLLLGAGIVWWLARNLLSFLGLVAFGCVVWAGISSAQAYADHGDPYLALLSGVDTLLEHVRQIWN